MKGVQPRAQVEGRDPISPTSSGADLLLTASLRIKTVSTSQNKYNHLGKSHDWFPIITLSSNHSNIQDTHEQRKQANNLINPRCGYLGTGVLAISNIFSKGKSQTYNCKKKKKNQMLTSKVVDYKLKNKS